MREIQYYAYQILKKQELKDNIIGQYNNEYIIISREIIDDLFRDDSKAAYVYQNLKGSGIDFKEVLKEMCLRAIDRRFEQVMNAIYKYLQHLYDFPFTGRLSINKNSVILEVAEIYQTHIYGFWIGLALPICLFADHNKEKGVSIFRSDAIAFASLSKPYSYHIPDKLRKVIKNWWQRQRIQCLKE